MNLKQIWRYIKNNSITVTVIANAVSTWSSCLQHSLLWNGQNISEPGSWAENKCKHPNLFAKSFRAPPPTPHQLIYHVMCHAWGHSSWSMSLSLQYTGMFYPSLPLTWDLNHMLFYLECTCYHERKISQYIHPSSAPVIVTPAEI